MQFGSVFDNRLPAAQRAYFQSALGVLGAAFERVEIPGAGSLELCHAAVAGKVPPKRLVAGGSNLLTAMVGGFAGGAEASLLGLQFLGDLEPLNELLDGPTAYGAMLVGYHAAQLRPDVYHEQVGRRALVGDRVKYAAGAQGQLDRACAALRGLDFRAEGFLAHMRRALPDAGAVIALIPPRTTDGVTASDKRALELIRWASPPAEHYRPAADRRTVVDLAMIGEAATLVLADADGAYAWPEKVVFAHELRADRVEYVLCSQPDLLRPRISNRPQTKVCAPIFPLMDDACEITPETKLAFAPTTREVAMYLRDLWAHKLGSVRAECYFLFLVDGHAAGVFGMFFDHLEGNRSPHVNETFGFNAPLSRHKRFNKLMMMCLVSGESRDYFASQPGPRSSLLELTIFQTTCISSHPELKTNRGLMKLIERRDLPGGRYYLNYRANFNKATFHDCLLKWLRNDANVRGRNADAAA